ncbi:hypothetical protein [Novacetimonas hansenii]|uniref:hypothetical protein n=1 Tax=Novacetimonas hansenii TaxID=436 RepID=UPI0030D57211
MEDSKVDISPETPQSTDRAEGLREFVGVMSGMETAFVALIDFYAKNGGPSHEAVAKHLQATADQLPKNVPLSTRRVLEHIADGVMGNTPRKGA